MRFIGIAVFVISLCVSAPSAWAQQGGAGERSGRGRTGGAETPKDQIPDEGGYTTKPDPWPFALFLLIAVAVGGAAWFLLKGRGADRPGVPPPPIAGSAATSKVPSIFISYRREDSADISGRISDRLVERFGKTAVFKDVDSIPFGRDFREHLQQAVGRCDALLVIIGKQWCDASAHGKRRLDDPRDHLRIEVETALARNIPVIPVLVQGASMPEEELLPESLRPLAYRNAIPVRPDPDFNVDLDRLIRGMQTQFDTSSVS